MTRLLWFFALSATAIWTLLAWGAYGVINFFGETAARNADVVTSNPTGVEWLSWILAAVRNVGLAAVVVVWGVVSVFILAVPTLLSVILGRGRKMAQGPFAQGPFAQGPIQWPPDRNGRPGEPRPGYRDVTPEKTDSDSADTRLIDRR